MCARFCLLSMVLCCCSAAPVSTAKAFDVLKGFQGTWEIEADGKQLSMDMSYDIGSKQSIVSERFGKELSVFYRSGESVEMVHFCNAGNQPRLRLKQGSEPDVLEFEMFAITNLSTPDAPHVQEIIYKLLDANTMGLEIIWSPSPRGSEKYKLTRRPDQR